MKLSSAGLAGLPLLLVLGACGSAPPPPPQTAATPPPAPQNALQAELAGAPKWVQMGCGAFFGEKKKLVCGVGAIGGMTNPGLARSAAEGRARTDIARSLQVRVKAMLNDYQAATQGGPANKTNSEQHIEDVSRQITNLTLSGTRLQDTWISNGGTFYALVVLDTDSFRDQLKNMQQLDDQVREAIVQRAEKKFEELDSLTEGPLPPLEPGSGTTAGNN